MRCQTADNPMIQAWGLRNFVDALLGLRTVHSEVELVRIALLSFPLQALQAGAHSGQVCTACSVTCSSFSTVQVRGCNQSTQISAPGWPSLCGGSHLHASCSPSSSPANPGAFCLLYDHTLTVRLHLLAVLSSLKATKRDKALRLRSFFVCAPFHRIAQG